jgi:hypothetical protein
MITLRQKVRRHDFARLKVDQPVGLIPQPPHGQLSVFEVP